MFHLEAVARPGGLSWKWVWGQGARELASCRAHREHVGGGVPVVLSGVAIVAGNAHFMGSRVPIHWHPVSKAEGCGPQVRELGLSGAGNHIFCPLCWHSLGTP